MIGIYKIQNLVNGKVYIGQSINVERRFSEHRHALMENKHFNRHLQAAWHKYGSHSFVFEIVEECDRSELNERETFWKLQFDPDTYNLGHTNFEGTTSPEVRKQLSERFRGDNNPAKRADVRKKISSRRRNHSVSSETRMKISNTLKGKYRQPKSDSHVQALRNASPNKKAVKQFTKSGQLIKIWECVNDASRELGISQANISDCCRGIQKSAHGFIWKY